MQQNPPIHTRISHFFTLDLVSFDVLASYRNLLVLPTNTHPPRNFTEILQTHGNSSICRVKAHAYSRLK